jgi:hypothetical protein
MWIMGGSPDWASYYNDVWYSTDGANWTAILNANWSGRYSFTANVYDDKMWVMGGMWTYSASLNDVWYYSSSTTSNQPPNQPYNETPVNGTSYKSVYYVWLNVSVSDPDGDTLNVGFFYGNGTHIVTIMGVLNGSRANCSLAVYHLPYPWVSHDMTYYWYVTVDDGTENITGPTWNFHTSKAWDLNEDLRVNYLDLSGFVSHYSLRDVPPGADPWDINDDTYTNYLDMSSLVNHYGEIY